MNKHVVRAMTWCKQQFYTPSHLLWRGQTPQAADLWPVSHVFVMLTGFTVMFCWMRSQLLLGVKKSTVLLWILFLLNRLMLTYIDFIYLPSSLIQDAWHYKHTFEYVNMQWTYSGITTYLAQIDLIQTSHHTTKVFDPAQFDAEEWPDRARTEISENIHICPG